MDTLTVSLFGHREIEEEKTLSDQLTPYIVELLQSKKYVVFLIGRNGEFDELAASIIKSVRKEKGEENNELTLVLPYPVADLEYYEKYYDHIIIPEFLRRVHPKASIVLRNRWMIEQSDLVIAYAERRKGGAYAAMKYAERKSKPTIRITAVRL